MVLWEKLNSRSCIRGTRASDENDIEGVLRNGKTPFWLYQVRDDSREGLELTGTVDINREVMV